MQQSERPKISVTKAGAFEPKIKGNASSSIQVTTIAMGCDRQCLTCPFSDQCHGKSKSNESSPFSKLSYAPDTTLTSDTINPVATPDAKPVLMMTRITEPNKKPEKTEQTLSHHLPSSDNASKTPDLPDPIRRSVASPDNFSHIQKTSVQAPQETPAVKNPEQPAIPFDHSTRQISDIKRARKATHAEEFEKISQPVAEPQTLHFVDTPSSSVVQELPVAKPPVPDPIRTPFVSEATPQVDVHTQIQPVAEAVEQPQQTPPEPRIYAPIETAGVNTTGTREVRAPEKIQEATQHETPRIVTPPTLIDSTEPPPLPQPPLATAAREQIAPRIETTKEEPKPIRAAARSEKIVTEPSAESTAQKPIEAIVAPTPIAPKPIAKPAGYDESVPQDIKHETPGLRSEEVNHASQPIEIRETAAVTAPPQESFPKSQKTDAPIVSASSDMEVTHAPQQPKQVLEKAQPRQSEAHIVKPTHAKEEVGRKEASRSEPAVTRSVETTPAIHDTPLPPQSDLPTLQPTRGETEKTSVGNAPTIPDVHVSSDLLKDIYFHDLPQPTVRMDHEPIQKIDTPRAQELSVSPPVKTDITDVAETTRREFVIRQTEKPDEVFHILPVHAPFSQESQVFQEVFQPVPEIPVKAPVIHNEHVRQVNKDQFFPQFLQETMKSQITIPSATKDIDRVFVVRQEVPNPLALSADVFSSLPRKTTEIKTSAKRKRVNRSKTRENMLSFQPTRALNVRAETLLHSSIDSKPKRTRRKTIRNLKPRLTQDTTKIPRRKDAVENIATKTRLAKEYTSRRQLQNVRREPKIEVSVKRRKTIKKPKKNEAILFTQKMPDAARPQVKQDMLIAIETNPTPQDEGIFEPIAEQLHPKEQAEVLVIENTNDMFLCKQTEREVHDQPLHLIPEMLPIDTIPVLEAAIQHILITEKSVESPRTHGNNAEEAPKMKNVSLGATDDLIDFVEAVSTMYDSARKQDETMEINKEDNPSQIISFIGTKKTVSINRNMLQFLSQELHALETQLQKLQLLAHAVPLMDISSSKRYIKVEYLTPQDIASPSQHSQVTITPMNWYASILWKLMEQNESNFLVFPNALSHYAA